MAMKVFNLFLIFLFLSIHFFYLFVLFYYLRRNEYKLINLQGAKQVLYYHIGRVSQALLDLFPEIGLSHTKLFRCMFPGHHNKELWAEERRSGGAEERRSGGAEERRSGGAEERRSARGE